MGHNYSVLGAGMQGTSTAYDLARFGDADQIVLGDVSPAQAEASAKRVNGLIGREVCCARLVDALDPGSLTEFIVGSKVLVSCVPYWMHPKIAPVAIAAKVSMVDMGGDTRVSRQTLALDPLAKDAGVTVVPDTGLAPGLVNNLAAYFIEHLECVDTIRLYCGGLPQNPKPPLNYKLLFNVEGLVTEYMDKADILRDGRAASVETLEELETLQIDGLGTMEAFVTSGGTSTACETWMGTVRNYEYKTIRYPGHCELVKIFKRFGFWGSEPIKVRSGTAIPREVFNALMGPALRDVEDRDLVVVRGIGTGELEGRAARLQIDILQKHDETTGFSAMEQLTGTSTAIYAAAIANQEMAPGCLRYETAMTGKRFVDELKRRDINLTISSQTD